MTLYFLAILTRLNLLEKLDFPSCFVNVLLTFVVLSGFFWNDAIWTRSWYWAISLTHSLYFTIARISIDIYRKWYLGIFLYLLLMKNSSCDDVSSASWAYLRHTLIQFSGFFLLLSYLFYGNLIKFTASPHNLMSWRIM